MQLWKTSWGSSVTALFSLSHTHSRAFLFRTHVDFHCGYKAHYTLSDTQKGQVHGLQVT